MKGEVPHYIPKWIPVVGYNNDDMGTPDTTVYSAKPCRPYANFGEIRKKNKQAETKLPKHLDLLGSSEAWGK